LKEDYANLFYILNLVAIIVTLMVLIRYAGDTRRIADQTQETNLRPVILRAGFIQDWQSFKPISASDMVPQAAPKSFLEFIIFKNIATDIKGCIIIDHYKYQLLFGSDILQGAKNVYVETWGWIKPDNHLYAVFKEDDRQQINGENKIHLSYKDIEGNSYYTNGDKNFVQTSCKVK
jgi:hypothetical protein